MNGSIGPGATGGLLLDKFPVNRKHFRPGGEAIPARRKSRVPDRFQPDGDSPRLTAARGLLNKCGLPESDGNLLKMHRIRVLTEIVFSTELTQNGHHDQIRTAGFDAGGLPGKWIF
jgi:hypothetical protein